MAGIELDELGGDSGLACIVWQKLHRDGYSLEQLQDYILLEGDLEFSLRELIDFVRQTKEVGEFFLQSLDDGDCDHDENVKSELLKQQNEVSRDILIERGTKINHAAIVKYFKIHANGTRGWEKCLAIEAMTKEGINEAEIRRTIGGQGLAPASQLNSSAEENYPRRSSSAYALFVEAVLMGEKRNYYRAMAMKFSNIPVEAIFQRMCVVEGADPDLMAALLQPNNDSEGGKTSQEQEHDVVKLFENRDYRGFRAVRQTVHLEKAKHMKRVGVPDGAIRQRLWKENVSEHIIDELFSQFERSEKIARYQDHKVVCFEDDRDDSYRYDDDDDSDSDVEEEQDSTVRLRRAVFRKVKSMVERGKPDTDIRNELVAMKGVDPTLVSFFLGTTHLESQESQSSINSAQLKIPPVPDNQSQKQHQEWVEVPASAAEAFPLKEAPRHGMNAKRQLIVGKIHFLKTLGVSRDVIVNRLHSCGISAPFVRSVLSSQPTPTPTL